MEKYIKNKSPSIKEQLFVVFDSLSSLLKLMYINLHVMKTNIFRYCRRNLNTASKHDFTPFSEVHDKDNELTG